MANTCRSCVASIQWAVTTAGKKVPLNTKPLKVFVLVDRETGIYGLETGFESHFATCPEAKTHRKDK